MALFSAFQRSRAFLKDLHRLADAQERSAAALERIAEKFAPAQEEAEDSVVKTRSSVSYSRDEDLGRAFDYVERVRQETGRDPTEEEVEAYLDGTLV